MPRANQGPDATVTNLTTYPLPLEAAKVGLKTSKGGLVGTTAHRLTEATSATASRPTPSTYIDPRLHYVLVDEPGPVPLTRLVRTVPEGKVIPPSRNKAKVGPDNRVRITNTTAWPHRALGALIVTYQDGKQFVGTGTLVNKHHVLTAGHLVYLKARGGWVTSVQFNAAQDEANVPYGSAFATRLITFKGWKEEGLFEYDTGMLILDRDVGNQTGWMGLITTEDEDLSGHQVTVEGYPSDKGGRQRWGASAPLHDVESHLIKYDIFTALGESGAGVYGVWPGFSYEHVCANHQSGGHGITNQGSRLARDKFDRIVTEWLAK